jgi:energy-coupling factor transporter transmembrane protein EcfT
MQRTRHNQGPLVKTLGKVRVTPHSLILSIPIFIFFALINVTHVTLILQAFFLGIAVLLCGFSLRGMRFLPLLPLLLFIFVFNSFRGGGEILFRAGPLIIMQQGVGRGLYYALFVMELFTMSTILTRSFTEHDLVSALYTINRLFSRGKGAQDPARTGGFALMLFYILRIFHGAYCFFPRSAETSVG